MHYTKFLVIMGAALMVFGLGGTALAFHDGGVAHCDGCHTMHNSPDNPVGTDNPQAIAPATESTDLTKGSDPSSTCLNCHAGAGSGSSYHIFSTNASVQSPGGDFFWLTKDYTVEIRTDTFRDYFGRNHGHNVVAADFGLVSDVDNTTAPGGTYLATNLGCTSCHDPHGQVLGGTKQGQPSVEGSGSYGGEPVDPTKILGNYRLLGDSFYEATGDFPFSVNAPIAAADPTRSGRFSETDASHVAYGSGMSEWCGQCHTQYLNSSTKHPAGVTNGVLDGDIITNYNQYVASGDFTSASWPAGGPYQPLVPYETGGTDRAALQPTAVTGPVGGAQAMCLTCHRAHASAFNNATRWDTQTELLRDSLPTTAEIPEMADNTVPYYGRDVIGAAPTYFGPDQRSLCNKCHVWD